MEQPTKEEKRKNPSIIITYFIRRVIEGEKIAKWLKLDIQNICDAYLALKEEVKAESKRADKFRNSNAIRGEKIKELEAENQALRALCENLEISIPTPLRVTPIEEDVDHD